MYHLNFPNNGTLRAKPSAYALVAAAASFQAVGKLVSGHCRLPTQSLGAEKAGRCDSLPSLGFGSVLVIEVFHPGPSRFAEFDMDWTRLHKTCV